MHRRIEELLAPQQRFDEVRRSAVLRHGVRLADLSYANAYGGPPPEVLAALHRAIDGAGRLGLQYTPYGGSAISRRLVAEHLSRSSGVRFDLEGIVLTPGAMAASSLVLRALREEGPGEVVIPVPCWFDHPLHATEHGFGVRLVPCDPNTLRLDFAALERVLGPRTVAVVLTQPGNPSGVVHDENELRTLAELLGRQERAPLLISDECHRDVSFSGDTVPTPAAFWARTVVLHSLGKALRMQGQRLGWVAASPSMPGREEFVATVTKLCRVLGFCTPTALMQAALGDLLAHVPDWSELRMRRLVLPEALRRGGYTVAPSQASFFLYPRTPRGDGDDWKHVEKLAERGVLAIPATVFHHRGHFRLSLTCSDAQFETAVRTLGSEGAE